MENKFKKFMKKNLKYFIFALILWVIAEIVLAAPIAYTISESYVDGKFDIALFIQDLVGNIVSFSSITKVFDEAVIGVFEKTTLWFGAIIAISISAIITLITGGLSKAAIMLVSIIILQQIDANIINPKIIGDSLEISPILVILSVTIGGGYFGVIGMFLGVPVAAILKILVNDYIDNKLQV